MAEEIAFMVSLCWDTVQNAVYTQITRPDFRSRSKGEKDFRCRLGIFEKPQEDKWDDALSRPVQGLYRPSSRPDGVGIKPNLGIPRIPQKF
jgi:hypothetical protein